MAAAPEAGAGGKGPRGGGGGGPRRAGAHGAPAGLPQERSGLGGGGGAARPSRWYLRALLRPRRPWEGRSPSSVGSQRPAFVVPAGLPGQQRSRRETM